ncbi:MAG: TetR/AcrR family transcriptional regulator [Deltaproteobacteria bacterium]|jgi:AcrR family transcriptional regulator|nr:TetR/AcrR family transcriptional regulator [Deltaproteobacteria bacterium]
MKHAATDTAAAIKAAAKELFAKHGYSATTTRQIARAVSLQAAAIYYHFRSKNEILLQLLSEGNQLLLKAADEILTKEPADPVRALRLLINAHLRILADDSALFTVLTRELKRLEGGQRTQLLAERARYEQIVQSLVRRGIEAGQLRPCEVKTVSFGIIGLLNSVALWYQKQGPLSLEQVAREYADMLFCGLSTDEARRIGAPGA